MSEGGDFSSVIPYGFDDSERFSLRRKGISTTRGYYNDKKELHWQGVLQRQEGSNSKNSSDDERYGGDTLLSRVMTLLTLLSLTAEARR
jgi:hypothetical protein